MSELGINFGEPGQFYVQDRWNQQGYYEAKPIIDINSRIVTGWPRNRGRAAAWISKLIYLSMPSPNSIARRAVQHRASLRDICARYSQVAVKDPRICLTLGAWLEVAPVSHVVVCLREPRDVVLSLQRRDHIPAVVAFRFWAYHIDNLLNALPADRSVLISFDKLRGPERVVQLKLLTKFLKIDIPGQRLDSIMSKIYSPSLVHGSDLPSPQYPPRIASLWNRVCELAVRREREIIGG